MNEFRSSHGDGSTGALDSPSKLVSKEGTVRKDVKSSRAKIGSTGESPSVSNPYERRKMKSS